MPVDHVTLPEGQRTLRGLLTTIAGMYEATQGAGGQVRAVSYADGVVTLRYGVPDLKEAFWHALKDRIDLVTVQAQTPIPARLVSHILYQFARRGARPSHLLFNPSSPPRVSGLIAGESVPLWELLGVAPLEDVDVPNPILLGGSAVVDVLDTTFGVGVLHE